MPKHSVVALSGKPISRTTGEGLSVPLTWQATSRGPDTSSDIYDRCPDSKDLNICERCLNHDPQGIYDLCPDSKACKTYERCLDPNSMDICDRCPDSKALNICEKFHGLDLPNIFEKCTASESLSICDKCPHSKVSNTCERCHRPEHPDTSGRGPDLSDARNRYSGHEDLHTRSLLETEVEAT